MDCVIFLFIIVRMNLNYSGYFWQKPDDKQNKTSLKSMGDLLMLMTNNNHIIMISKDVS